MSTSWVAGSVRARALSRRRVGPATARELAQRTGLQSAVDELAASPYGHDVRAGQGLAQAQHAVASTLLWHLRVLAGWVPRGDARILRVLAGGFEIANVDGRLRELSGAPADPAFRLGTLATAWPAISRAETVAQVRECLARSAWGDPAAETVPAVRQAMRLSWAARVASGVPRARPWAAGAAAILVARDVLFEPEPASPAASRLAAPLLGSGWAGARSIGELASLIPVDARWGLAGSEERGDLWRAESAWWRRLDRDGRELLREPVTTSAPVIGAVAVLAADAWRVRAALEVAARGGVLSAGAVEAFDAVA